MAFDELDFNNRFYSKKVLRILKQTGSRTSVPRDRGRSASLPGKRLSASGKTYWETRKNRSDDIGKTI